MTATKTAPTGSHSPSMIANTATNGSATTNITPPQGRAGRAATPRHTSPPLLGRLYGNRGDEQTTRPPSRKSEPDQEAQRQVDQILMIEAAGLRRSREIEAALKGFERELLADDGRYCVHVTLPDSDGGLVAVLNALEAYVRERGGEAARIEYDGRIYTLEASPSND